MKIMKFSNIIGYISAAMLLAVMAACGDDTGETRGQDPQPQPEKPTVETVLVSTIGDVFTSVSAIVSDKGTEEVTERGFCYALTSAPTTADSKVAAGAGEGVFSAVLEGLTPETKYYVRAYAVNSVGTSYGQTLSFTTIEEGGEPIPGDPYEEFKADNTLRFERTGIDVIYNAQSDLLFYKDDGGLFSSTRQKIGYGAWDASSFYLVEWVGGPEEGAKISAAVRTRTGAQDIHSLSVVKYDGGVVWVVYKTAEAAAEEFAVQQWD